MILESSFFLGFFYSMSLRPLPHFKKRCCVPEIRWDLMDLSARFYHRCNEYSPCMHTLHTYHKKILCYTYGFLSQVHWNNPEMRDDYSDSSGMTLHYTPKLRPNSAVMLMVGQWYLEIPPGRERHAESAVCSKEDTHRLLTGPIKIVRALNHMHYLGTYTIRTGLILAPA